MTGATFLAFGLGSATNASAQVLQLKGSDTLELVTKDAISAAGLGAQINYVGGGSGAGENAMIATPATQHVSPMSRQLNSGTADPVKCTANAQQLLIGLDGIALVAANQTGGDSLDETPPVPGGDDCSDSISGGKTLTVPACNATDCDTFDSGTGIGTYTFASWKDVLAMVYGGQNHKTGTALFAAAGNTCTYRAPALPAGATVGTPTAEGDDSTCNAGEVCYPNGRCGAQPFADPTATQVPGRRNPARINCLSPVRQALVDNWGFLFSDVANPPAAACRTAACTKLRRAFRRDDLSGTTDTFVGLVGLPTIANPTKAFILNTAPISDRAAVASPFCNGGEKQQNKGDTDYLDLDPIRRSNDLVLTGGNRFGLEQVDQLVPAFAGNNNDANCNTLVNGRPHIPEDHGNPTSPGIWPDPDARRARGAQTTDELLTLDRGASFDQSGLQPPPFSVSTSLCLGLVVPITLPANFVNPSQAYFGDPTVAGQPTVLCTPGALSSVIYDLRHPNALCPNGKSQALTGPCDMPVALNPDGSIKTFNCLTDQLNPQFPGVAEMRVFNLHPVDVNGHLLVDNYVNPSIAVAAATGITAAKQARNVTGFFRLHTTRTTTRNGSTPTLAAGVACNTAFDSTTQIGCLVKANSCTMGFAGREAVDRLALGRPQNLGVRIEGITVSTPNIEHLATGGTPVYPIARKLWFNSVAGFSSPTLTASELALFNFENSPAIDPIVLNHNFVVVPATHTDGTPIVRLTTCPATN